MGYVHARTDEVRAQVTRAALNTDPGLGRTAGALYEGSSLVTAPVRFAIDSALSDDGDAKAQGRMDQRGAALSAFDQRMRNAQQKYGQLGPIAQLAVVFAEGVAEHAARLKIAGDERDYVGQGQAGANLAIDATAVAGAMSAARSFVAVGAADAGVVVEGAS